MARWFAARKFPKSKLRRDEFGQAHLLRHYNRGVMEGSHSVRTYICSLALLLISCPMLAQSPTPAANTPKYKLTITVENMDSNVGNLGILIFSGPKGWAEDRQSALKDISVPAQQGVQKVDVQLPPGRYAVALVHDLNMNHKLDKNFLGMPKEFWGLSNNPHATLKAPPIEKCYFTMDGDKEVKIQLQK